MQRAKSEANYAQMASLYLTLGGHLQKLHLRDSAAHIYRLCKDIIRDQPLDSINAELDYQLGNAHKMTSNYASAKSYYESALGLVGRAYDSAKVLNALATLEYDFDHYEEALSHYQDCLRLYAKIGQKPRHAMVQANIGNVFDAQGDFDSALLYYMGALAVYRVEEPQNTGGECWLKAIIGSTYLNQGSYLDAEIYLDSAEVIANTYDYDYWQQFIFERKADLFREVGNSSKSLEYFQLFVKEKDSMAVDASRRKNSGDRKSV